MEFAIWAYPWDLLDEGVNNVADSLRSWGVSEINLSTNYHTVQTFLPHNPERRTYFARPSCYFQPGTDYGRLEPVVHERMGDADWVADIGEGLAGTGVSLNSWTVGCLNSRLGLANPDLTFTSPAGDSQVWGLCPSNTEVQQYLTAVVGDLASRGSIERIELESFDYMYGTGYGWHHAKYHTQLGRLGEFLFGLCFCEACRQRAGDAGIDVERARRVSRRTIDHIAEGDLPYTIDTASWLREHSVVDRYAANRLGTLESLYEDLRSAAGDTELGAYIGMLDVEEAYIHGIDPDALSDYLDYYVVLAYEGTPGAVADRVKVAQSLAPDLPIHCGLLPGHPAVTDGATVRAQVNAAADLGVPRVSFYNYGLLPQRNLEWIGEATEPYR